MAGDTKERIPETALELFAQSGYSGTSMSDIAGELGIATDFGETLSWEYLCYVRKHPIVRNVPTCILYGEHWFHTDKQMRFLDEWIREYV